ncbi:MAG: fructosamine kinase family protein [Planctomycetes bacterium]|nr:fructosamine kinase family protein [Planctomycetota bacterium]
MDHLSTIIKNVCSQLGYGSMTDKQSISGGCISDSYRITCDSGSEFFIKHNEHCPTDFFAAEAAGLQAMHDTTQIRVPQVLYHNQQCIVMEYIHAGQCDGNFWPLCGQQLAQMHQCQQPSFGFKYNTYCGSTEQINSVCNDGIHFFAEHRLMHLANINADKKLLDSTALKTIEHLCQKLPNLLPAQPPSLLHGDLWSGNVHSAANNQPVLIDPACYWGMAEAEIAMTRLFGAFPEEFYQAYNEVRPLDSGWQQRLDIYNLYHLLNHLYIFGNSYHGQVMTIATRYC